MIAIGYIRISTKDQSAYSLDYQERRIREYCEANKLTLVAMFKDDGESSYSFDRPDWKALETFIKKNKQVSHLIILDHDRFSRNLAEALLKIKELQDKYKIKVLATTDNIDTDFSDPTTFIMRAFKLMMAESELHGIRKRTRNGIQQANMNGRFVNAAPYGYINSRDANNKPILQIDEEKASIIRKIFKEYINGATFKEIRAMVKPLGYEQKGRSTIQDKLLNPIYAGLLMVSGKKNTLVKGIHPPIISETDYWITQDMLQGRKPTVRQNSDEVPLRGVLRCWCGRLVTAGKSKGKYQYYWYYWCTEHKTNLPAKKLHEQFNEILATLTIAPEMMEIMKEKLIKGIADRINERGLDISKITNDLANVQGRISTLEKKYLLSPAISEKSYNESIAILRGEEARLQQQFADANTNIQVYFTRLADILSKLGNLKNAFDEMDVLKQQQFINVVFKQSLSYANGSFRTPYLLDLFEDKELILNEKGLLKKEQPVINFGSSPMCSEEQT
jgi:site-specific DNA recombinase